MSTYAEIALYIYGFAVDIAFHDLESLDYHRPDETDECRNRNVTQQAFRAMRELLQIPGIVCLETGDHDYTFVGFPVELVTPNDSLGTWTAGRGYNQVRRQLIDQAFSVIDGESHELINESLNVHWALSDGDESICSFNYDSLRLNRSEFGKPLWASSVDVWLDGPNKGFLPTTAEELYDLYERIDPESDEDFDMEEVKVLYQLGSPTPLAPPSKIINIMPMFVYGFVVKFAFHDPESLQRCQRLFEKHDFTDITKQSFQTIFDLLKTPGIVCFETNNHSATFVGFPAELVTPNKAVGIWTAGRENNQARFQLISRAFATINEENPAAFEENEKELDLHVMCSYNPDEVVYDFNYDSLQLRQIGIGPPLWASSVDVWLDGPNKWFRPTTAEEYRQFQKEPDNKENKENWFNTKILYQL